MTAYIFTGGQVFADSLDELGLPALLDKSENNITAAADKPLSTAGITIAAADKPLSSAAIIAAADSGYNTARRLGVMPELLVGDLDSIDKSKLAAHELDALEKLIVPSIKDDTDTQLAVDTLLSRGADDFVIIGGLGGRLDHTLSTVFLLEYIADRGAKALITDGRNRVRLMRADTAPTTLEIAKGFKYLSLVSLTDRCEGVSISGVFYPLDNATLERKYSFAVSNEITADRAKISLKSGSMLVIESRD